MSDPGRPDQKKIFCIGFNKTGTVSLYRYFKNNGIASVHNDVWPHVSKIKSGQRFFEKADCYSDGQKADFVQLDRWFSGALFILNTRDERAWLRSRVKHVLRFNRKPDIAELMATRTYGSMLKDFFFDEETCLKKWIAERRLYQKQARTYFAGNPRFLDIDITTNKDWQGDIADFAHSNGLALDRFENRSIHENKRDVDAITDAPLLDHYFQLIDEVRSGFD